jgi:predicted MPP superfamily phosphohydrolase
VRALLIGDIHLADRPPSIRTETYTEDILAKLKAAADLAVEHDCEAIVLAGDVFHIKTPTRNSHALVQATGEVLTAAGLPVLIVPGNHDLSNDRLDSLRKQPLGTLAKMQGIDLLIGPHAQFPLFGLPYLADWGHDLPRWMTKYREWADAKKAADMDFWPLMVTHAPIFPPGEEPPYEFISGEDWAEMMVNGDCYYGHIHTPHGVYVPSGAHQLVTLCNHGAISRGSLHEETLKREPAVTVWDSEAFEKFARLPLPFRPAEAVFRLAEKEDVDEHVSRVSEFLESVGHTRLDGLSLEEVHAQARARGLSPRTLALIEDVLEVAT